MYILLLFDIVYLYFVLVISNFVYNAVYKAIFYVQTHTTKLNKHKIKIVLQTDKLWLFE